MDDINNARDQVSENKGFFDIYIKPAKCDNTVMNKEYHWQACKYSGAKLIIINSSICM